MKFIDNLHLFETPFKSFNLFLLDNFANELNTLVDQTILIL